MIVKANPSAVVICIMIILVRLSRAVESPQCETAMVYCGNGDNEDKEKWCDNDNYPDRWGWTNRVGTNFVCYIGAGKGNCNEENGFDAGWVEIDQLNKSFKVHLYPGMTMSDYHIITNTTKGVDGNDFGNWPTTGGTVQDDGTITLSPESPFGPNDWFSFHAGNVCKTDIKGKCCWATCCKNCTEEDSYTYEECIDAEGKSWTKGDDDQCARDIQHPSSGGVCGDPHFKTWRGHRFDFHGECDLVLVSSPTFDSGRGLDVHIRTQIRKWFSFTTSAALRIGTDILEVGSRGLYYLNGLPSADLGETFAGFPMNYSMPSDDKHVFDVQLDKKGAHLMIVVYKDFVSIKIDKARGFHFAHSEGLMGTFQQGIKMARDGVTIIQDANAFGQEWQVLDSELKLFHDNRFPQYPQTCTMPPAQATMQSRRRLGESLHEIAAENACAEAAAHWEDDDDGAKEACIYDVLATGDLEMAQAGVY